MQRRADAAVIEFLPVLELCDDTELSQSETQPLVFVAGYVALKVGNKLTCNLRKQEVISDKAMQCELTEDYQYLSDISRGGLKWPTDFLLGVVTQVFICVSNYCFSRLRINGRNFAGSAALAGV